MTALRLKTPPTPPAHWLWGHTKMIFREPLMFPVDMALSYKPICQVLLGVSKIYITADAEAVKQMLLTHTDSFVKGPSFKTLALLGGRGLLTSEGAFWKRQRRLAQPGFHKEKLRGFLQTFIDCSYDLSAKWDEYPAEGIHQIAAEMGELTMRIIGKTLFGIELFGKASSVPSDVKEVLLFLNQRIFGVPKYPMRWPFPSHNAFFSTKKRLDDVVYKIIDQRVSGQTTGDDLLQTFLSTTDLDTGEKMARDHIRDEVMTLFLAGFETSSVALTWTWYMLSQNKAVHRRFLQELQTIVGNDQVRPEHISRLVYTRAIIEETLRLYPPAYNIPRQLIRNMEMLGYRLEKGKIVLASIYALHRNPDYWPDPDVFDPGRFMPENQEKIVKNAYIPFGAGQRMCIGNQFALMEMTAALAVLGMKYRLTPAAGYTPEVIPSITTNVSEGMPMHISKIAYS